MEIVNVLVWVLCFIGKETSASNDSWIGTKPLTWTVYTGLGNKTWNEASMFCRTQGSHLPAPKTNMTMHALRKAYQTWLAERIISYDIWIGLHSSQPGEIPNVWEADCSTNQPDVQDWARSVGEPDHLDIQHCVRLDRISTNWRTIMCNNTFQVVCEKVSAGSCSYVLLSNVTMTGRPSALVNNVSDVDACWSFCLALHVHGRECAAAVLDVPTKRCLLYFWEQQLDLHSIDAFSRKSSITMLRDCFRVETDASTYPSFTFTDNSEEPKPANATNQTTAITTSSAEATTSVDVSTTTSTAGSKQRLCPCSCAASKLTHDSPKKLKPEDIGLIPVNKTSRHRRAKTSEMVSKTSYTVVGTAWIIASGAIFVFFAMFDLKHIKYLVRRVATRNDRRVDIVNP